MVAKASRLLIGVALAAGGAFASLPASAQVNPFVPGAGASRVEFDRLDAKLKSLEAKIDAAAKAPAPAAVGPTTPGAVGPTGTPLVPGSAGISYPGVPGQPGAMGMGMDMAPADPIETARGSGVRFLGCINGVQKFVKKSGERVSFTPSQINRAVKDGSLPACR